MLLEQTQALLHSSKLPKNLWGETITHVVWLKNRTSTCALPDRKTPYEMLYGRKPNLRDLHEWGSDVLVHTTEGTKLDVLGGITYGLATDELEKNRTTVTKFNSKVSSTDDTCYLIYKRT